MSRACSTTCLNPNLARRDGFGVPDLAGVPAATDDRADPGLGGGVDGRVGGRVAGSTCCLSCSQRARVGVGNDD